MLSPQPKPKGTGVDVAQLVYKDIEARIRKGEIEYGERLTTLNGRSALMDLYEELLDAVLYLRQLLWEENHG